MADSEGAIAIESEPPRSYLAVRPVSIDFDELYQIYLDFVWRSLRRLGAPEHQVDDLTQEVFIVAFRRLSEFEGRSSYKTWLFGIALRVARDARRAARVRRVEDLTEVEVATSAPDPRRHVEQRQAVELLYRLLEALDEPKREVFVLAELEQLPAPEIAELLGIPINTVYSRLRVARQEFDAAHRRHLAAPTLVRVKSSEVSR